MRSAGYLLAATAALCITGVLTMRSQGDHPAPDPAAGRLYRVAHATGGACGHSSVLAVAPRFVAMVWQGTTGRGQSCDTEEECTAWLDRAALGTVPSRPEVGDWSRLDERALVGLPWQVTANPRTAEGAGGRAGPQDFAAVTLSTSSDASGACSVHRIRTSLRVESGTAALLRVFEGASGVGGECPAVPDLCVFELRLELETEPNPS